jgi:hypothetical protein
LLADGDRRLGALPTIWRLQEEFSDEAYGDAPIQARLAVEEPLYGPLLEAIRAYERFARALQDAFDILLAQAAGLDARGYSIPEIARDAEYVDVVKGLHERFRAAHTALGEVALTSVSIQGLFDERFVAFAEPMEPGACAVALCGLHEAVQKAKSVEGKRPWFDRLGPERIYVRHAYRMDRREVRPDDYVHDYRGWPTRRFWRDLT